MINPDGKFAANASLSRLDKKFMDRIGNGELMEESNSRIYISAGVDPAEENADPPLVQFTLRESADDSMVGASVSGKAATYVGYTPKQLISQAFGLRGTATEFTADLPDKRFDLITRRPSNSSQAYRQFLKASLSEVFGVSIRQESRQSEVYVLQSPEEGEFKLEPTESTGGSSSNSNGTGYNFVNCSVSTALARFESRLGRPTVDESNITGNYDIVVKWEKGASPEKIAKSFTESTGLELTLKKRDVMFSIVESEKK